MTDDPYAYPGTDILRNKENIRDAEELARVEREAAAIRMEFLPSSFPISAEGYRAIHHHIFQDVYEWAGQYRTVDIAKDQSYFCRAQFISTELAKRFEAIQREDALRGLDAEKFADRAAEHISELNAIHPFREGNGRAQRAFLEVLARQAEHEIDLARIDPVAWNEASIELPHRGSWPHARRDCACHRARAGRLSGDPCSDFTLSESCFKPYSPPPSPAPPAPPQA